MAKVPLLLAVMLVTGSTLSSAADLLLSPPASSPTTTAPTPQAAAAAAFNEAVTGLTAEDFTAREKASKKLQNILAQQLKAQAELQDTVNQLTDALAAQMKVLGATNDPETRARVAGILEIQKGLVYWTAEVLEAPVKQRHALLEWGCGGKVAPVLGKLYGRDRRQRVAAVQELAKLPSECVDWLFARLLEKDDSTAVCVQVLACLWDRKPATLPLAAMYKLALPAQSSLPDNMQEAVPLPGRGQPEQITIQFPDHPVALQFPDAGDSGDYIGEIAPLTVRVLMHVADDRVARHLEEILKWQLKEEHLTNLPRPQDWQQNFHHLLGAYKIKAAIPYLAAVANGPRLDTMMGETNNVKHFWTNRTDALGTILEIIGAPPEEYHLIRGLTAGESVGELWGVDTEAQEQATMELFHIWWKKHYKEYGVTKAPADLPPAAGQPGVPVPVNVPPPASAPATVPATMAAPEVGG